MLRSTTENHVPLSHVPVDRKLSKSYKLTTIDRTRNSPVGSLRTCGGPPRLRSSSAPVLGLKSAIAPTGLGLEAFRYCPETRLQGPPTAVQRGTHSRPEAFPICPAGIRASQTRSRSHTPGDASRKPQSDCAN